MTGPRTFTYSFDDAPVLVIDGFTAAKASGHAEVDYAGGVHSIFLEGDRKRTQIEYSAALKTFDGRGSRARLAWEDAEVAVQPGTEAFEMIRAWIEKDEDGRVAEAIRHDAEDFISSRPGTAADHRRDLEVL
jgi:hypothetical protein